MKIKDTESGEWVNGSSVDSHQRDRIDALGDDLQNTVFLMLDNETGLSGDDCGRIAAFVAKQFRIATKVHYSVPLADYSQVVGGVAPADLLRAKRMTLLGMADDVRIGGYKPEVWHSPPQEEDMFELRLCSQPIAMGNFRNMAGILQGMRLANEWE